VNGQGYPERIGETLGFLLGLPLALGSILRGGRIFHPEGIVFSAEVVSNELPAKALVRFSSGWWKKQEWPDLLGVSLRLGADLENGPVQDLLLASFPRVPLLTIAPLLTDHHDFLNNDYYALTPFEFRGQAIKLRLRSDGVRRDGQGISRADKLRSAVAAGRATLILESKSVGGDWEELARVRLKAELDLEQEALCFTPFNASHLRPVGFINYLRLHSYHLAQAARQLLVPGLHVRLRPRRSYVDNRRRDWPKGSHHHPL
jgi:hypothetical protein